MNDDNYIDIPVRSRDRHVYRVVSVLRLLELFRARKNVLVQPGKWEDPFENFIVRRQRIYGQCWTRQTYSDAVWRIYSHNASGVRIRSTPRQLAEGLSLAVGRRARAGAFIGTVRYLNRARLLAFAASVGRDAAVRPYVVARTLLVKRPAFRHEREVRLLFLPPDGVRATDGLFAYDVDPHTMIDQIMIDPRMPEARASRLRSRIIRETGFAGPIKRSLLYAPPPEVLIPFNLVHCSRG